MADRIELTDLEVISRFSLAVRSATAERAELIEALRADLAYLESGAPPGGARRLTSGSRATKRATRGG